MEIGGYLHVERKHREPSQSHAWIFLGAFSQGWIPFDPTVPSTTATWSWATAAPTTTCPPNKGIYRGAAREMLAAEVRTHVSTTRTVPQLTVEMR